MDTEQDKPAEEVAPTAVEPQQELVSSEPNAVGMLSPPPNQFVSKYDWPMVRKFFIECEIQPTMAAIGLKFNIPKDSVVTRARRENWLVDREAWMAAKFRESQSNLTTIERTNLELESKLKNQTLKSASTAMDRANRLLASIPINKSTGLVDGKDMKDGSSAYFKVASGMAALITAMAKAGVTFGVPLDPEGEGRADLNKKLGTPIMIAIQQIHGKDFESYKAKQVNPEDGRTIQEITADLDKATSEIQLPGEQID